MRKVPSFVSAAAAVLSVLTGFVACESSETPSSTPSLPEASAPFDATVADAAPPDAETRVDAAPVDAGVDADTGAPLGTVRPFATGLDNAGAPLADGQVDGHWTVKDADGVALTAYAQTDALGYPGYWLAPSATSKFVSPFTDTVDPTGMGTFTYATTFTLKGGTVLADVALAIRYASDNATTDIRLNGASVGTIAAGGYGAFTTVEVTTGFVVGKNTVEIVVANSGGPTGMRAELDLTVPGGD